MGLKKVLVDFVFSLISHKQYLYVSDSKYGRACNGCSMDRKISYVGELDLSHLGFSLFYVDCCFIFFLNYLFACIIE